MSGSQKEGLLTRYSCLETCCVYSLLHYTVSVSLSLSLSKSYVKAYETEAIYLLTQTGFLGLWGKKVDSIEYYTSEIERLSEEVSGSLWMPRSFYLFFSV